MKRRIVLALFIFSFIGTSLANAYPVQVNYNGFIFETAHPILPPTGSNFSTTTPSVIADIDFWDIGSETYFSLSFGGLKMFNTYQGEEVSVMFDNIEIQGSFLNAWDPADVVLDGDWDFEVNHAGNVRGGTAVFANYSTGRYDGASNTLNLGEILSYLQFSTPIIWTDFDGFERESEAAHAALYLTVDLTPLSVDEPKSLWLLLAVLMLGLLAKELYLTEKST